MDNHKILEEQERREEELNKISNKTNILGSKVRMDREYPIYNFDVLTVILEDASNNHIAKEELKSAKYINMLEDNKIISNKIYKYALTPKGGFYIALKDAAQSQLIRWHSDFKGGRPVQCAGMVMFDENNKISYIDNGSTGYQPNKQNLEICVNNLKIIGLINNNCQIKVIYE